MKDGLTKTELQNLFETLILERAMFLRTILRDKGNLTIQDIRNAATAVQTIEEVSGLVLNAINIKNNKE